MLRARVRVISTRRTDITSVYRNQIEIRMRKLKPKVAMLTARVVGSFGLLLMRPIAPIERARPKTRSVRDSIRGRGR